MNDDEWANMLDKCRKDTQHLYKALSSRAFIDKPYKDGLAILNDIHSFIEKTLENMK